MKVMMASSAKLAAILASGAALSACGGNAGEGTTYDEQLRCFTVLMGVNAVNRGTEPGLRGGDIALHKLKMTEVEQPEKAQQVREDIHASSFKIQEIVALKDSPEGAAQLAQLQTEAQACSEKFEP